MSREVSMFPTESKFLVVDDFLTMRKIMQKVLTKAGYQNIETASGAEQAFQMLQAAAETDKPFDIVLSDWNMPEMSGLDLLKACRLHKTFGDIPFIMVTAESDRQHLEQAAAAKVSNFIRKPFNENTLVEILSAVYKKIHESAA